MIAPLDTNRGLRENDAESKSRDVIVGGRILRFTLYEVDYRIGTGFAKGIPA
jgi:hypothetical protein